MTDALDSLIAAVANGIVSLVAAGRQLCRNIIRHIGAFDGCSEAVLGVVTVIVLGKAKLAEIKVIASSAMDELVLGEFCGGY